MIYKRNEWDLVVRLILLFILMGTAAWFLLSKLIWISIACLPLGLYLMVDLFRMLKRSQEEIQDYVDSIHYRDFSRFFNVKQAPADLKPLRQGFNEINNTVKQIGKEKELQYQYLQNILELIDTGIISYEVESGAMNWMNETFKKMLGIPYLKTIHSLKNKENTLYLEILELRPGESKVLPIQREGQQIKLLISASLFMTENKVNKIIAFQNINETLDQAEAEAWQKLLRVMTHEIMNSVAPIASLAGTLKNRLAQNSGKSNLNKSDSEDLEIGLETIERRGEGLLKFAETFRNLNKISQLNLQKVYIRDLFASVYSLMQPTLDQRNIELEVILKERSILAHMDINLVEQVLLNLIINAMESLRETEQPKIRLSANSENGKTVIKVLDNGPGIHPDVLDKIFVPFFSTKKNGSGIGLALSQQIMLLHKGSIHVASKIGEGTIFSLRF